ncbi:Glutathione transporter 1 [Colletotrichum shisoi]|uniref:Glutathione transporter 1 n=1 Tax=Colletotrichum shisoi TaxID=2078593 RepID=A0A5Q4C267_9PEZI|nr:Glutathione transporter 1 [Colletotrichum shisoi]
MAADISHTPPPGYVDSEKSAVPDKDGSKTARNIHNQDVELENGHLAELEVDMGRVLDEEGEGDYEADTSPFPQATRRSRSTRSGLSYFTWICWIAPNNLAVNQVFGMVTGMGLFPLTFDWSMIAYNTNPLLSPQWAALNVFFGFALFFWIVTPAIYFSNAWFTSYMPFCTADVYDRFGTPYDVSKVLTDNEFDRQKYAEYSPPYLPATFAFVYGLSFASITSVLSHVYFFHFDEIMHAMRGTLKLDIHARLMKSYETVKWWWWVVILLVVFGMSVGTAQGYDTGLPWWGVILAFVIPAVYMVPCGMIQGVTNVDANQLNVLSEFIGGYLFRGKPVANILFKILSTDVVGQGLYFAADMKLGHYLKIPPVTLFFAQGLAAVLGALTQTGVTLWMLGNVDGICTEDQPNGFSCPNRRTVFSSSVIWGLVGPARLYSVGAIYSGLLHFFWVGLILPPMTYFIFKKTRSEFIRKINWPLIFVGTYNVPPATGINYSSWYIVNLVFNKIIYRKFYAWWSKYNYVLAAALDTGLAISGIVIFFAATYGPNAQFPDWWGNTVWQNTADGLGLPWLEMPAVGYFGPANGTWS